MRWRFVGFVMPLSVALLLPAATSEKSAASAGPLCLTEKREWRDWSRAQVSRIFEGDFGEDVIAPVVDRLGACEWQLSAAPKIQDCLSPLSRFARALSWDFQPGHSMGLAVSDADYFDKGPYPDFLELPKELKDQEFLSWVQDDEGATSSLDKALAYVDKVNAGISEPSSKWITFTYRSLHLPTADDAQALGRFFVYVPGKNFDRYLQFGLRSHASEELPNAISLISVQKMDPATGKPLPTPLARAKDLWRLRQGGTIKLSTRFDVKGVVQNCYECHKTPLLPITPDASVFDENRFGGKVRQVNKLMTSYSGLKFFGLDPKDYGPGIGPVSPASRTTGFMKACSSGKISDARRLEGLKRAMSCQNCHNGAVRGALNFPSAKSLQPVSGRSLVRMYVVDHGKMPPGQEHLTREEREVLAECLRVELYGDSDLIPGLLKEWLLSEDCWDELP